MFGLHYWLERKAIGLALAIIGVASIGGLVDHRHSTIHRPSRTQDTGLHTARLAGRNIYVRGGCSPAIPRWSHLRGGRARCIPLAVGSSTASMLWGSKRTRPDLPGGAAFRRVAFARRQPRDVCAIRHACRLLRQP
jgi:cytochrome c oxidase cbb3-type subunit 2